MTKKPTEGKVVPVLVEWVDATSSDHWMSLQDAKEEPSDYSVFSMGFMIERTEQYVRLASNLAEDEQVFGVVTIPVPWVKGVWEVPLNRIRLLKPKKRGKK